MLSFLLKFHRARQFYRIESQHPPGRPVTAAERRTAIKETECMMDEVGLNWRFGTVKNAEGKLYYLQYGDKQISKHIVSASTDPEI